MLLCYGVEIPTNAKFVGDGNNNGDNCGDSAENRCGSLSVAYQRSAMSGDRHVQIYNDFTISEDILLENGGIFYTYGIISNGILPKISGGDFHITANSNTSWCILF
jgi:hypothetical protein